MKPTKKTVEIHIKLPFDLSFPFLDKLRRRYLALSKKKQRVAQSAAAVVLVALIALATIGIISNLKTAIVTADTPKVAKKYTGNVVTKPDYTTILPTGKTIESLGGWTRVSPPDKNPVFAYVDTINGKQINVSEQPLPDEFKTETTAQIQQLAAGYKATDKVTVGDVTVFVGTSAKGPQSVIFVKNKLLMLIKSSVAITDDEWAGYVNSLK